jgi:hypothetical protein
VQVELQRLFKNMPFGLPTLLGNRNEFVIELSVNLGSEFFGRRGWQVSTCLLSYLIILINQVKS